MLSTRIPFLVAVTIAISLLALIGCGSAADNDPNNGSTKYEQYLSFGDNCVIYRGPWIGMKNDDTPTKNTELHAGDFLRFYETVEVGEILTVLEVQNGCAVVEYTYYSLPPASEERRSYEFDVCQSD